MWQNMAYLLLGRIPPLRRLTLRHSGKLFDASKRCKGCKTRFYKGGSRLSKQTQLIIFLILLAIVDTVIPVPITALVLIMVVFQKPGWFRDMVDTIYLK